MGKQEKDLMAMNSTKPKVWWHHIDDIFTIWEHGQDSLELLLQQSNLFHTTIKFTAEMSMECITFLDTTVILENDILHTNQYTKPTDTTSTYHPIAVIPNTTPPQSHTDRASDSVESAQEERTLWQDQLKQAIPNSPLVMYGDQRTWSTRLDHTCPFN